MLQILSTSNETATGTELVQNGDFSEIGSDLVTNGDFSAAGINLVDNPNFTDGTDQVLNGDFATDLANWNNKSATSTWVSGSAVVDNSIGNLSSGLYQDIGLVSGKSYKLTATLKLNSGDSNGAFRVFTSTIYGSSQSAIFTGDTLIIGGASVTETFYFTHSGTNVSIQFACDAANAIFEVDNVSCEELGADWDVSGGLEFTNDGAYFNVVGGIFTKCSQSLSYTIGNSYKVSFELTGDASTNEMKVMDDGGSSGGLNEVIKISTATPTTHTFYFVANANSDSIYFKRNTSSGDYSFTIDNVSVQELGEGWVVPAGWSIGEDKAICDGSTNNAIRQSLSLPVGNIKVTFKVEDFTSGTLKLWINLPAFTTIVTATAADTYEAYITTTSGANNLYFYSVAFVGSFTNVTVQQLDPNDYWTLGTGWSIGADKAISTVTGSNSDITQSILTAGKTYRTVYEIVDYTDGTAQAVVTGSEGADAVAIETYTEDLTTTGTDFSIRSKLGTFDGSVSSVSVKQLGTYEDQSIYVTAADVQTIAQASVYYLVELTSMGSKNSLYFIPSSVVPNNGRYTKLNFTVISKDAIQQPTVGIISFYDSVGGLDTYPMGFYEFRIYEQTSSTNLDPTLATGLLEKGFAFVRDFSGNMQELTDDFNEYDPTLTQYVYSK